MMWAFNKKSNWLNAEFPTTPTDKPEAFEGKHYVGNATKDGRILALTINQLLTHQLVLGTTGSGKSEYLLSLLYQAMLNNSGFCFVDGKGDIKLLNQVKHLCDYLGMPLKVLNFSRGAQSHTLDPFSNLPAHQLREIMAVMLGFSGDSKQMWEDRALLLLDIALCIACDRRDTGDKTPFFDMFEEYMSLDGLEAVLDSQYLKLKLDTLKKLGQFLNKLPNFNAYREAKDSDPNNAHKFQVEADKQYGYCTMQLAKLTTELSIGLKHVFGGNDVTLDTMLDKKECVYIVLPALELSKNTLKQLGSMIVASLRAAIATRLKVEQANKNTSFPYTVILDEYTSYAVDGFAEIPKQARSLNVGMVFASQEFKTLEQLLPAEATSIKTNTGTKLFFKNECPEAAKMLSDRIGRAPRYVNRGVSSQGAVLESYKNYTHDDVEFMEKFHIDQLAGFLPGQCFVTRDNNFWEVQCFYTDVYSG